MSTLGLRAALRPRPTAWLALLLLFIGLLTAACTPRASAGDGGEATLVEGRRLFVANCSVCHGEKGDRVPVAPLNSKEFLDSRGDATLVHAIGEGKGVMPAWGKARGGPLGPEQISVVVAYLNSAAGRTSPTLLASSGRAVFQQGCVRCHGEKGDRIPVAPLSAKPFLDSRTDGQLLEAISEGKGMMPAFRTGAATPLTEEQVRAVVSYLRYTAEASLAEEARRGRDLYVSNCLACHGERGDRVPNVLLAAPEQLRRLGDGTLAAVIAQGKGVMPGFSPTKGGSFQVADVGALLAYLKSWAGLPAGSALALAEMPSQGRELYVKNCAGCHAESGDRVAGVALKTREFLEGRSDDTLTREIAQGNTRGMPAWGTAAGGPLSDADIKNIVDYLRSATKAGAGAASAPGAPAPAAPVSEALAARGKELYTKSCAACHGETRDKLPTAKLADPAWLKQRGDAALAQSIANGKGAMPAWGKEKGGTLSQDDIGALLAYLTVGAGGAQAPAAGGGAAGAGEASLGPEATKGKELYTKSCTACHGEARDKLPTAKLADGAWLQQRGDAALTQSIAGGKRAMPAWGKEKGGQLSGDDIAAILAYLKEAAGLGPSEAGSGGGTARPTPAATATPAAAIALSGDAARGKDLYGKNCGACHGEARDKVATANLADGAWLQQRGDAVLSQSVANGKGAMPAWGQNKGGPLSPDDVAALLAFLKAMAGA